MGGMLLAGMHNGERCYCIKRTEQHKIGKPALFGGGLGLKKEVVKIVEIKIFRHSAIEFWPPCNLFPWCEEFVVETFDNIQG